jgi:16S rRNA processing protein RimM
MKRRRQEVIIPSSEITGSPQPGEPVFLAVGFLRRPHGLVGEIIMDVQTDFPERIRAGRLFFVGEDHRPMRIRHKRMMDQAMLIHFEGIENPESAASLRNNTVYTKTDSLPELPEGEYYHHQLYGLKVIDEAGQEIGMLTEIIETGATDVYVATSADGKEILLPALQSVILEINLDKHEMKVKLPIWE